MAKKKEIHNVFQSYDESKVEIRLQNAMELLKSLGDESVDLVLTDPPYGISYQSNRRKGKKLLPITADWNFQMSPFLHEIARVLKPGSAAYLFTRWDVYPLWAQGVPPLLTTKNFIIWLKDNHSAGDLTGNFGFKYEGIMMMVKGRHKIRGHRHTNVWEFPRVPLTRQRHPAEKPVALLQRAIESSTDKDALVVDPFCGSGSTAEAALLCGRRALVGDIDKRWLSETRDRLGFPPREDHRGSTALDLGGFDLSILDGVHPEDVLSMLQGWREMK